MRVWRMLLSMLSSSSSLTANVVCVMFLVPVVEADVTRAALRYALSRSLDVCTYLHRRQRRKLSLCSLYPPADGAVVTVALSSRTWRLSDGAL